MALEPRYALNKILGVTIRKGNNIFDSFARRRRQKFSPTKLRSQLGGAEEGLQVKTRRQSQGLFA
jgi:hypothetical protein